MYEILEKYREDFLRCMKCGSCQAVCPTYIETRDESMVARGRLVLSEAVIDGKLGLTNGLRERLSKCLGCMACTETCPTGIDVVKLLTVVRSQIVEDRGLDPISSFVLRGILKKERLLSSASKIMELSARFYNSIPSGRWFDRFMPFTKDGVKRFTPQFGSRNFRRGLPEVIRVDNPAARVAFFTGCMTDFVYQDAGKAVISVLKRARVEIILPKEQICCGAPAYYMGDRKTAIDMAERNIEIFKRLNVDAIVNCCATCGTMLKEVYPILADSAVISNKVVDIQKFIADRFEIFKSPIPPFNKSSLNPPFIKGGEGGLKVTYHDPCHLRRGQKVIYPPREILKNIPGMEYIEMEDSDRCCGGGGTF
ncbi:MAG: (Fe-S)-binding protein, partial [Nitrospinae bacterium]|nr:(Fe-S)-binding protein [Nitrospinota bacterium]